MTGWLLDTNVVSEIMWDGGSSRVKQWLDAQPEHLVHLSILTVAEYEKGIANLPDDDVRRAHYVAQRDLVETRFRRRILPISNSVVRRWGVVSGEVRRVTGHPPPVIDTLLAATAIEHDLTLVTRNLRDVQQSGAQLLNPWTG